MQNVKSKIPEILEIINTTTEAVSIDFVAYRVRLNWQTVRVILLELALDGKIIAEKTTKSWIFKPKPSEALPNGRRKRRNSHPKGGEK